MCRERKLYTTSKDPYCRFIKQYFNENNVDYIEVDISKNEQEFYELLSFYGSGPLPVLVEDGKIIPVSQLMRNGNMTFSGCAGNSKESSGRS